MTRANRVKEILELANNWLETKDIYYRDKIKALVSVVPSDETRVEALARLHLIEFPEDTYYAQAFMDAVADWRANGRITLHRI